MTLQEEIIKLAQTNPDGIRQHLIPILREAAESDKEHDRKARVLDIARDVTNILINLDIEGTSQKMIEDVRRAELKFRKLLKALKDLK